MKTRQLLVLGISICYALVSCGGGETEEVTKKTAPDQAPPKKVAPPVEASEPAKRAALARVATMKQITAVLKPLREPAAALTKEKELKKLFTEYNRLTELAASEGISGRQLARLTTQISPGDWADTRAEFQQYMLLVRQLGDPQRDMMNRLMNVGTPDSAQTIRGLDEHLKSISTGAGKASEATRPARQSPTTSPPTE